MKKIREAVSEARLLFGRFDRLATRLMEIDSDLLKEGFSKEERKQLFFTFFGEVYSRSQIYRSMPIVLKRTYSKSSAKSRIMRHSSFKLKDGGGIETAKGVGRRDDVERMFD
jgi:hypothetical protein